MTELPNKEIAELFRKNQTDLNIYHDLMQFRVREILLVTSFYDAYILEQEGRLTEQLFGEYHSLRLSSAPRIANASSGEEALGFIKEKNFDLVILTLRIPDSTPFDLSTEINKINPKLPVLLLLYDNNDIQRLGDNRVFPYIDKIFVWNRDANIFLAMLNYIEDKMNADKDTRLGLVRVILLVENSIRYYSRYLPVLYNEIILQAKRLIEDEHTDELIKVLRLNARPKVLIAVTYEEAIELFERYKDYLICVISDFRFPKEGKIEEYAGIELIKYVKEKMQDIPTLMQSSDNSNRDFSRQHNSYFIDKNSDTLASDLKKYIFKYLGFGDFIFRNGKHNELKRASNMRELRKALKSISSDSLYYHASRNHFSAWLMARGEIQIARKIQPIKVTDFRDDAELRKYLIEVFDNLDERYIKGKVVDFDEQLLGKDSVILKLAEGSLGGKGRGLSFINALITNLALEDKIKGAKIKIPGTAIIGTSEFDKFIQQNKLEKYIHSYCPHEEVKQKFLSSNLSRELKNRLKVVLKHFTSPLAVRSSSLFEDSVSESFSGIYQTYLLPNNNKSAEVRLNNLMDAIKLVYASVYSKEARQYFEAIDYKAEEEKMAVIIQELVGGSYGDYFYPHFSGVAQSYNYYPISRMKPSDGIAIAGVGLGKYVIDGEKAFRFCPKYPKLEIDSSDKQLSDSQSFFYAIDLKNSNIDLMKGEDATLETINVSECEQYGILDEIASVWDPHSHMLKPGLTSSGTRVINFNSILKYNSFPFAAILNLTLEVVQNSMGIPAEIEFAVDLNKDNGKIPVFYILQIKPFIREADSYSIKKEELNPEELMLFSTRGMGNGKIEDIYDIIYAVPDKFDKSKTVEMTFELEKLNHLLKSDGRKYILIGPGRWGTRDRWLGIPVAWAQISNAKVIVETDLEDFCVDASLGSHFFHNVTSMNIGYLTVHHNSGKDFIDWKWLNSITPLKLTDYFAHLRFTLPLKVIMDGRKGLSAVFKNTSGK